MQAQACRVCHLLRGTGTSDIDFNTFQHFDAYKDRIKVHVVDRGNMPLAKLVTENNCRCARHVPRLTDYLGDTKMPGRPIADPGPDRGRQAGREHSSAAMSLFSSSYQVAVVARPEVPWSINATSAAPTFTATQDGTYEVRLVASNSAGTASAPATLTIVVDSTLPYTPTALRFAQIKTLLQAGAGGCDTCHRPGGDAGAVPAGSVIPPMDVDFDRAATGDANDATNLHWLYTEVRGRINFTDIVASPLLRKPSGNHHNGGSRPGFNASQTPGNVGRADYDMVLNWILNGAPE